jgi:queuine tRNA-ribosyltransferase
MFFSTAQLDPTSKARLGKISTAHGEVLTPAFMPDATRGAIQYLTPRDLDDIGLQILVANTLHLFLRPGSEIIRGQGGLHRFMGWSRPILTDGGGFQIYSLIHSSNLKGRVTDEGMEFQSPLDGSMHLLTPEQSQEVQFALGSDIKMAFDDCIHAEHDVELNRGSVHRTTDWSKRAKQRFLELEKQYHQGSQIFAIIQGGADHELRRKSAEELIEIGFDGYAFGGWPLDGEGAFMQELLGFTADLMPADKPKYAMGVGTPLDIMQSVLLGYDLFDCVMPTRNARHGTFFTSSGKVRIVAEQYKDDTKPLDDKCECSTCKHFSRAYIRHLYNVGDPTGKVLGTFHNLFYYVDLMKMIRQAIGEGTLAQLYREIETVYS